LNGIIAINIREGDRLIEAKLTNGNHELILAVKSGRAIHFHEKKVRPMGRNASGVRGIRLSNESDEVVGMVIADVGGNENVLVVSENGYGKRSKLEDYRVTNRGGKGVKTINVTEKTGKLIGIKTVIDADDVMIITRSGNIIRLDCKKIRVLGRATQGVKLIQIKDNDSIAAVATVENNEQKNGDNADEIQNGNDWNGIENNNDISDEEMMNNDEEIEDENNVYTKEK
jgi:DNA gyrase subunit A